MPRGGGAGWGGGHNALVHHGEGAVAPAGVGGGLVRRRGEHTPRRVGSGLRDRRRRRHGSLSLHRIKNCLLSRVKEGSGRNARKPFSDTMKVTPVDKTHPDVLMRPTRNFTVVCTCARMRETD